jgi:putative salt-induced outer membrane protein YdiY
MTRFFAIVGGFTLLAALPGVVEAQDGAFVWENATELSFVSTGGNASSSTLGLNAALTGTGGANTFRVEVGGIRAESSLTDRVANGTAGNFDVTETTTSELIAESYFARGRYERAFGNGHTFFGSGWDRNTFAGIQNRYAFVGGVGRSWTDSESGHFQTDIGLTYTIQKDVEPDPAVDDAFGGWQASVDAARTLSATTEFTSKLVVDNNLERTADLRADWVNALSVSIDSTLALKTSLQLLWDNKPSLISGPLLTGGLPAGDVTTEGEKLDSVFTLTLVITL